jgi:hypothetical protein
LPLVASAGKPLWFCRGLFRMLVTAPDSPSDLMLALGAGLLIPPWFLTDGLHWFGNCLE